MAWLLSLVHMIPVYRFRDGVKGLRNNDIVFQTCVRLLSERQTILIFGEGDQNMHYHLQAMQKGFARIAWAVQQQNDWKLPLYIVPTGIQYDHYYNFRTRVLVNYGKAIPIDASYQQLPEREFLEAVVENVKLNLKSLMVHIDHEQYDVVDVRFAAGQFGIPLAEAKGTVESGTERWVGWKRDQFPVELPQCI